MDPPELKAALPSKLLIKAGKFTIGVSHGYGAPQKLPEMMRQLFKKDDVDLIVFGHSHQPAIIQDSRPWLFNPGSPTDTIFAPYKSFGIIEINDTIELRIIKL
jgi:putative phosphoesterase